MMTDKRGDLTLEEKQRYAAHRAREEVAEKYFYDEAEPYYPAGFSVYRRNVNHWDISAPQHPGKVKAFLSLDAGNQTSAQDGGSERAFRIRGEPGNVIVMDERWDPYRPRGERTSLKFRDITAAMVYISGELMQEPPATTDIDRALFQYEVAFDNLFGQCLSNGMKNAWGKDVDLYALNEAHLKASNALREKPHLKKVLEAILNEARQQALDTVFGAAGKKS